ncbi:hypothetical protein GOBAR_AA16760 [Gossypium barbadense]|uniref:Cell wall hydroxyproline-rich glycoprotein n=1 Tax=Gossypium barbadense TaxID=3634 RepID=A0A2P5XKP4_GOSBA|nr:hypothetical protein GOBAR_AA16760 [Gossypium barbadense]
MKNTVVNNVLLIIAFFVTFRFIPFTTATSDNRRRVFYYGGEFKSGAEFDSVLPSSSLTFDNPRLKTAYIALQAWKQAIISDPLNLTSNWVGSNVCNYTGVFCSPALDDPAIITVAGIDLNHGDIAGTLPKELGLLNDIALFHVNSNRFCGGIPWSFKELKRLFELDLSNNRFAGKFPYVVLRIPNLKFLDIRFNEFEGLLFELPENIGNSPASVIVLANNRFHGCLPRSMGSMSGTLNEVVLSNNGLHSCLPEEIGSLKNVTVFDVKNNELIGELPESIGKLESLEHFDLSHNMLSGTVHERVCSLPNLMNFSFNNNFFTGMPQACLDLEEFDDRKNCFDNRDLQRSRLQCYSPLLPPFAGKNYSSPPPPVFY